MSNANISQAISVNMGQCLDLLTNIHPDLAVCIRGRHAVGKSEGVYQAAAVKRSEAYKDPMVCAQMVERMGGKVKHPDGMKSTWTYEDGIPVMERRLSQMTEGDTIGIPFDGQHGTVFKSCDWLITSCDFPVVLFLDERNRALDGVKQSVFQLCDSKAFYGNRLNDETHVVIAENVGDSYQVQACDPAEVSRCATVVLEPTVEDWLEYAKKKGCDGATIEFVRANRGVLEFTGIGEPNKKYPDRRSWFKVDVEARRLGLFDDPTNMYFYTFACSMLGVETGGRFVNFCKERERQISADDILKSWKASKKRLSKGGSISNEMYIECVAKMSDFFDKKTVTDQQATEVKAFLEDLPGELVMVLWAAVMKNRKNLAVMYPKVKNIILGGALGTMAPTSNASADSKKKETEEAPAAATAGRGRRAKK